MRGAMPVLMLALVLVLEVLDTPQLFTPESLKPMKLLVETGLVDDHGMDGLMDVGILVTEIEIPFVFPDKSRNLPRIQLRGNILLRRLSLASFAIDHPSRGQTFSKPNVSECGA